MPTFFYGCAFVKKSTMGSWLTSSQLFFYFTMTFFPFSMTKPL